MWDKLSTREKRLIIGVAIVIGLIGAYRFLWLNQFSKWAELKQQLTQEEAVLTKEQQQVAQLPRLQAEAAQLEDRLASLRRDFQVTLHDGNSFVEMGLRSEDNVTLMGVYPQPVVNKGSYQVLPVEIKTRGSYVGQLQFVEALESMPQMTEISAITMEAADPGPYPELDTTISLLLYSILDAMPGQLRGQWELGRFDIFSPALQQILNQVERPLPQPAPSGPGQQYQNNTNDSYGQPEYRFPVK